MANTMMMGQKIPYKMSFKTSSQVDAKIEGKPEIVLSDTSLAHIESADDFSGFLVADGVGEVTMTVTAMPGPITMSGIVTITEEMAKTGSLEFGEPVAK